MNKSDSIKELATALSKFQGKMLTAHKGSTNPFFKSKYADLAEVVKTATPGLSAEGLSVSQLVNHDETGATLVTIVMHSSGEWISGEAPLLLTKQDPQGQGSAISYARRYNYMAAIGMVADEDDDGNTASAPKPESKLIRPADYKAQVNKELEEIKIRGRLLMVEKKFTPHEITELCSLVLDKDKPETVEDWQELIKSMED